MLFCEVRAVLCIVAQSYPTLQPHGLKPARFLRPGGFSRQECWSGLLCSPPGHIPNPGIKPRSPALQADSSPSEPPEKPHVSYEYTHMFSHRSQLQLVKVHLLPWTSQVALVVKNLPAVVGDIRDVGSILGSGRSPGGGHRNPLLAWRIPWTGEPGGLWPRGSQSRTQLKCLSMRDTSFAHWGLMPLLFLC